MFRSGSPAEEDLVGDTATGSSGEVDLASKTVVLKKWRRAPGMSFLLFFTSCLFPHSARTVRNRSISFSSPFCGVVASIIFAESVQRPCHGGGREYYTW